MKFVVRTLALLVTVVLMAGALSPAPAQAGGYKPKPGGKFNVPRASVSKEFRLERQVLGAIKHAKKHSTIRIAVFSFDRKPVAQALINARKRGVKVQILLNNHQVTGAQKMLHRGLGKNRHKRNFSYECSNGCRSIGENEHTKFYLFSHTGKAHDVVMTGSANLTLNGVKNQYNDLYTHNNGPKVYKAFNKLFRSMRKDKRAKPLYWVQNIGKKHKYQLQAMPYPHFNVHNDPIMTILNRVKCLGAKGGTGKNGRTKLRVSMHAWNQARGTYLARRMRQLYGQGCDVQLQYGFAGADVRAAFGVRTPRGYVPVHTNGYDTNDDDKLDLYSHQKILLISGHYKKDHSTQMVVTGSSNWDNDGLKGDEEIFTIKGRGAFANYLTNFHFLWSKRSHLIKYVHYRGLLRGVPLAQDVPQPGGPEWEND